MMFDIPGKKTYDGFAQIGIIRCNARRGETAVEADPYGNPEHIDRAPKQPDLLR